jgi:hypothetical protein
MEKRMSKQLLREFHALCPDGRCLDLLTEREKKEVVEEGAVYLTGRIQTADKRMATVVSIHTKFSRERWITTWQSLKTTERVVN